VGEPISLVDVVKRGGYEASLITTFNATLPFYEEFVLRKLIAAGSRYNVVLMDAAQCAQVWSSEAARPRLAGHAYALLPMKVPGAFHPKVCLLAGPRKASLLIGSHNLTLSGFGYNREVTNWIDVASAKDADGVAALADTWTLLETWISQQAQHLPDSVLESARSLTKFIAPLTQRISATGRSDVLGQSLSGQSLFEQLKARVPDQVERVLVMGAFFDAEFALLRNLCAQWPMAKVVVLIDPDTVHLGTDLASMSWRFVDARLLWPDQAQRYLHAKAMYFESSQGDVFVSGSANPSRPAWLGTAAYGNVEAVVVRTGFEAKDIAGAMGLAKAFGLPPLNQAELETVAKRGQMEMDHRADEPESVRVAIADAEAESIYLDYPNPERLTLMHAEGASADERWDGSFEAAGPSRVAIRPEGPLGCIRSLVFRVGDEGTLRAIVHHPSTLSGLAHTKRQAILREALGTLGSGEGDVARLIASVEKVIFSDDIHTELTTLSRSGRSLADDASSPARPASLGVHVADMPKQKRKLRLLKSGDLAYLLDVLIRRLGIEFERQPGTTDSRTRTEEEAVGQDDDDLPGASKQDPAGLNDAEIAEIVSGKARTLIRRMTKQLAAACQDRRRAQGAIVQLVAVLGLIRELRRLRLHSRWRIAPSLVAESDRRDLLDAAMSALLGSESGLLEVVLDLADEPIEEIGFLRSLLLWLAWDLGEELTDRIGPLVEEEEAIRAVRANAVLYELLPAAASDPEEAAELERSVRMTVIPTGTEGARATNWMRHHLAAGLAVKGMSLEALRLKPGLARGMLAMVPKSAPARLRVVSAVAGPEVTLWEFDRPRTFLAR
jgi:lambda repressor-like predicted transcriptional regulator